MATSTVKRATARDAASQRGSNVTVGFAALVTARTVHLRRALARQVGNHSGDRAVVEHGDLRARDVVETDFRGSGEGGLSGRTGLDAGRGSRERRRP